MAANQPGQPPQGFQLPSGNASQCPSPATQPKKQDGGKWTQVHYRLTEDKLWPMHAALGMPAGHSDPETIVPPRHPGPTSGSSGMPVRATYEAHMAHAPAHAPPAFRLALLVLA